MRGGQCKNLCKECKAVLNQYEPVQTCADLCSEAVPKPGSVWNGSVKARRLWKALAASAMFW